jgi:hypothetical protein
MVYIGARPWGHYKHEKLEISDHMPLGIDPWIENKDNYLMFVGLVTSIRNTIMITLSDARVLEYVNI